MLRTGQATLISDCQQALGQVLKAGPAGVRTATQDKYDVAMAIHKLWHSLTISDNPMWVEGHGTSQLSEEQQMNMEAHQLAISRLRSKTTPTKPREVILSQIATVVNNNKIVPSSLPQQIITNMHYKPIKDKIMKDKDWSQPAFDLVAWENFHAAFLSIPWSHCISITKLCQGLWNTNAQNERFYGQPNASPFCHEGQETLTHFFSCQHANALQARLIALLTYRATLTAKRTPALLVEVLVKGVTEVLSPGSVATSEEMDHTRSATQEAVVEQSQRLGWLSFLQGYTSKKWQTAFQSCAPGKTSKQSGAAWMKGLVLANWNYGKSIWDSRNAEVHGMGNTLSESKMATLLKRRIRELYLKYDKDKYCVPYTRTYLFDRPLLVTQQLLRDNMQCWIHSRLKRLLQCNSVESNCMQTSAELSWRNFRARVHPERPQPNPAAVFLLLNPLPLTQCPGLVRATDMAQPAKPLHKSTKAKV